MGKQAAISEELWKNLDAEQKEFYGDYYSQFMGHLLAYANMAPKGAVAVDPRISAAFQKAITSRQPKQRYIVEPWRYTYYHSLFSLLPQSKLRDDLIEKFVSLPSYKK